MNNAIRIVSIFTLPINIVTIRIIFPPSLSPAVIPLLKPTVANADTDSNTRLSKPLSGSVIDNKNTEHPITIIDRKIIAKALFTELSAISLRKISILVV